MVAKDSGNVICNGNIDTSKIYAAHMQIKEIVESFRDVNYNVENITETIKENWVGEGRNEFELQYKLLIRKIYDFGDTLQDIYDALVEAEVEYETSDDSLRKDFVKAVEGR
ncbi:MAG: WXG100 family type VII secretion target [Oscillospiraceae bacterium]